MMMKLLRKDLGDIFKIIDSYSKKHGLSYDVVEKDLWNCYFLDYLFNRSEYKDYFIFKGGTSLSKCYDLIDRYSEDLDIVLDSNVLNINLEEKIDELVSRNQKEKFIDMINKEAMNFIEDTLIPKMKSECEKEINKKLIFELDRLKMAFYVSYPRLSMYGYITPKIKIEMSSLSAIIPTEIKEAEPYINEEIEEDLKISFPVKCMKPKRTFWEKALILHQEANRVSGDFPQRYSRHYYDLYKIYNSSIWNETINDIKLLDEVRKFTMTFYNRSWARFEEAKPKTFKLVPNNIYLLGIKRDYEAMSQMIFGVAPSFNDIMEVIRKIEMEINNL